MAPKDATNVVYAWYVLDSATAEVAVDAVPVSTTSSYAVTAADVGKYIKVNVTGDEGSAVSATTTAAVEAAATDKIAITSAKQIGASKIEVIFNKKISTSDYDISVSRGTVAQTITTVLDDAATTATITLGTAASTADYTIKIVSKTDATESAESTVSCAQAALQSIDFLGDQLVLIDSTLKKAAVSISGKNQFEEEVALSGSLTVYSTKGTASYSQADKKITLDTSANTGVFFNTGEQVTVTAVYTNGSTPLQVAKALTVSNVATLTEFDLGDVATSRASLKDAKVNLTNLATDTYYFPVQTAKDQYGNNLTAKELDDMMVKSGETGTDAGNLYITPNTTSGAYAYITGFSALTDGTIAMNVSKGSLNSPGKAIFSITGVSGYQGTKELEIEDDPFIASLTLSAPSLYAGQKAEITISAKDQYGEEINLYNYIGSANDGDGVVSGIAGTTAYDFDDVNHLTKGHSSITFSAGTYSVSTNSSKKTVKLEYTPATKGTVIATVQDATPYVSNLSWSVDGTPTPAGISGLKTGTQTTFTVGSGESTDLDVGGTILFLDSTGAAINYDDLSAADKVDDEVYPQYDGGTAKTACVGAANEGDVEYYYHIDDPSADCIALNAAMAVVTPHATKVGTSNVKITLYSITEAGATDKVSTLGSYTVKFTTADGSYKSYKASLNSASSLLYVSSTSTDTTGFTVIGVDANGYEKAIPADDYVVDVDSTLTVVNDADGNPVLVSGKATKTEKGTAVATIWAQINGTGEKQAVATVDVPYDVAAPVAQSAVQYKKVGQTTATKEALSGLAAVTATEFTGILTGYLADGVLTIADGTDAWRMYLVDQYGLPMASSVWTQNGSAITAASWADTTTYAVKAVSDKVTGTWTVTTGDQTNQPSVLNTATSGTVYSEAGLIEALAKAKANSSIADTITLETEAGGLSLGSAIEIPANDTLVIKSGSTLNLNNKTVTNNGTIQVDGILTNGAADTNVTVAGAVKIGNGGSVAPLGDLTLSGKVTSTGTITVATTKKLTLSGTGNTIKSISGAGSVDITAGSTEITTFGDGTGALNLERKNAESTVVVGTVNTAGIITENYADGSMELGTITKTADTTGITLTTGTLKITGTFKIAEAAKTVLTAGTVDLSGATLEAGETLFKTLADGKTFTIVLPSSTTTNNAVAVKHGTSTASTVTWKVGSSTGTSLTGGTATADKKSTATYTTTWALVDET